MTLKKGKKMKTHQPHKKKRKALLFNGQERTPLCKTLKIGRNDLCPCGSKIKYKKCCMEKDQAAGIVYYNHNILRLVHEEEKNV